ncbi:glutathione binding-like protein [uncultured Ferrovibrio sp.]|uniref:glutathione S-transferase family protein n=1 Tax=uncultured Ferrovibrio sp. TaxID=1576913 RepID=UPI0026066023|nr:glutathione binding-like protein [uncultured Ferrovibrio sp.]
MIDLYVWGTSNGRKISIMLEETGLPYQVFPIDITKNEQFDPDFLKVNPNGKIPAIVDHDPLAGYAKPFTLWESGAILIYLAEKTGKFLPKDPTARMITIQWLMFQMSGIGPNFGQSHHFRRTAKEQVPYALKRFDTEVARLYGVMNERLGKSEYLAANEYTIADIATFPWVFRHDWQGIDLAQYPNVQRWFEAIKARPAVQRGFEVP